MIIFGKPYKQKYISRIIKTVIIVLFIIVSILLIGCSKDFNPTTTILKHLITNKDK